MTMYVSNFSDLVQETVDFAFIFFAEARQEIDFYSDADIEEYLQQAMEKKRTTTATWLEDSLWPLHHFKANSWTVDTYT